MKHVSSQRGQMTIEAVLILVIMVSFFTVLHRQVSSTKMLSKIVSGPWSFMQGMIENGVWMPGDTGKTAHPNVFNRRASPEPI